MREDLFTNGREVHILQAILSICFPMEISSGHARYRDTLAVAMEEGDCPIVRWQFEGDAPLSV
jgi:hypothetical protein